MQLKSLYESIIREQASAAEVLEFPHDNFVLSVFRGEKKLVFSPQFHNAITSKIRTLVNMLKQNFRILRVNDLDGSSFEVEVDPREDFEAVVDYIRSQAEITI